MARFRHSAACLWAVFLAVTLVGCSQSETLPYDLIPVSGQVWLDDTPLAGATVMFHPMPGTPGNGAYGVTDAEGKFKLNDYQERPGCPAGDYGVTFSKITQPDGSSIPPNASRAEVGMVEQIPAAYVNFNPTAVVQAAKVEHTDTVLEFKLDSKKKAPRTPQ